MEQKVWTEEGVNFVCRLKVNAKYEVQEEKPLFEKKLEQGEYGVYKIEHIHLKYKEEDKRLQQNQERFWNLKNFAETGY